jgi:hypothetical protein
MLELQTTRVVQLFFLCPASVNIAIIISDLQAFLACLSNEKPQVRWDLDDLVTLTSTDARLFLHLGDEVRLTCYSHFTLAIDAPAQSSTVHYFEAFVARLAERLEADSVQWSQCGSGLSADLLGRKAESMIREAQMEQAHALRQQHSLLKPVTEAELDACIMRMPTLPCRVPTRVSPATPAQETDVAEHRDMTEMYNVRLALYPGAEPPPALAQRIASQLLNLTVMIVWLPLGAALLALACWRGGDMRISAHAMVIAGLFSLSFELPGIGSLSSATRAEAQAIGIAGN